MDIPWILQSSSKFRRMVIEISSCIRRMCVHFSEISSTFRRHFVKMSGFRVSQQGASVWLLPAALRRPQKKHAPGFLEHVSCRFCGFLMILGYLIENWTSFTEKCVKFTKLYSKNSFSVFARLSPLSPLSRLSHGSGVMKCCWDPPFHTRRGSG